MPSGVTFYDRPSATEYVKRMFDKGYEAEVKDYGSYYKVYIVGKRERTSPKLMATEKMEDTLREQSIDLNDDYRRVSSAYKPVRSAQDIRKMAERELEKEGLEDEVDVHVSAESAEYGGIGDASITYPEEPEGKYELAIHPIHKFTNAGYLREVIKHEIKHIKGEINV